MSDASDTVDPRLRRPGRGAVSNAVGRYERQARSYEDDGWDTTPDEVALRTSVSTERPRSIITYNRSPDLPFDRSINPYRGCEHGCIYCFARPSHAWLGLSAGLDFETRLVARPDAPRVLAAELRKPGYRVAPIAIGTNTDPYQPIEKSHGIMRACLQVLSEFNHPVAIVTKGSLVERDIDILSDMAARGLARVGISVTTLDAALSRAMEPRAPAPARRLKVVGRLADAGIPVRAMVSPVIPGLTCHEIEPILKSVAGAGAGAANWIMLRLPLEVSPLFREWLAQTCPDRAARVMGHVRDMHGGKDYASDWGRRMRGSGPYAEMVAQRFRVAAKRLGLDARQPPLRSDLFEPPVRAGDQMELF
ncbi:DNA repair photolyase [Roseovarius atlanticus]|uniref:DNA repair photolyase n=1 Tax=Roseovarius atlanticus TaxID=1641875 RepID=A0A0T5P014_9RHOB|nr:PA0069 family radical SAM protein [Roseovarius atlanticus]KRS14456.1 DNA repair photolyase [Roseovarius atlanticus]